MAQIGKDHMLENVRLRRKLSYFGHVDVVSGEGLERAGILPSCWGRVVEADEGVVREEDGWMRSWRLPDCPFST